MTTYKYLLKHPDSKKHQAYMQNTLANLREYAQNASKASKRNKARSLLVVYESLFDRLTLQGA